jgi:predicted DNA-binding transcriptional regulator
VTDNNVFSPLQAIMQDPALTPKEKARKIAEYMERKRQAQQAPQPSPVVDPEPEPTKEPDVTAEIIQLKLRDMAEQAEHTDDNTYTIVENYALDHPDIGGREIAVYALLARRCHMPKMTCTVSISKLAERLKWKRETVSDALDKLIKAGLVKRERNAGGAYTYTLPHRHRTKKKDKAKAAAA